MHAITLDHVAVALEHWRDGWPRFAEALGGTWRSGGSGPGFAPSQLAYANEMRIELLMPSNVEMNDFLRRFLDASGPGPHHLTFKVDDLAAALDEVRDAGIEPVGVNLSDPMWKEAFLHPKGAAAGVVVQLAQASGPGWDTPPPEGFPTQIAPPASLERIVHAMADLDHGLALFRDLLGGREAARGEDEAGPWVELTWPGPGRIRLVGAGRGPLAGWVGTRAGRVHHLAFTSARPEALHGAAPLAGGGGVVAEPDEATGTRIVVEALRAATGA